MTFRLSKNSEDKLMGVHPKLEDVVREAIKITPVDFAVVQGVRTQAYQNELYAQGRTKPGDIVTWTKNSKHIPQEDGFGHAVDLAAYVGGKINWEEKYYYSIAAAMKVAAKKLGVEIECGIDWTKPDLGHFELISKG